MGFSSEGTVRSSGIPGVFFCWKRAVPQDRAKFGDGERRGGCGYFDGTPRKARNCGDRLKCTSALSEGIAKVHPGKRVFLSRLGDHGLYPRDTVYVL